MQFSIQDGPEMGTAVIARAKVIRVIIPRRMDE
jgi:hypothetical protein